MPPSVISVLSVVKKNLPQRSQREGKMTEKVNIAYLLFLLCVLCDLGVFLCVKIP